MPQWGQIVFVVAMIVAIAFLLAMCVGIQQSLPPMEESQWHFPF